ncbi:hypothetical protein C1701_17905 [Actinoalloteichus sp. AHMU CJ021]|uniref:acyltransferase family protein n=1 Tax=Actinoalloteichus sp. AHMU CJ021 TaxID=2072503 RepID=UPI000CA02E7F|nr:hypothetical protein C1701_17905 [Actinoalloteichus sp. AHMU CJ021]
MASVPAAPAAGTDRPKRRQTSWDLLRGFAIIFVIVQHATWGGPFLVSELERRPWEFSIQSGAAIMMMISGYFVCQTLSSKGPGTLLRNRLARMLPAFLVATLLTQIITHLIGPESLQRSFTSMIGTMLVLPPGFVEGIARTDGSYWTVPVQIIMFCVAALLWPRRWGHGWRLHLVLAAAITLPVVAKLTLTEPGLAQEVRSLLSAGGAYRAHLFAAGAALWLWGNRRGNWATLLLVPAAVWAHEFHHDDIDSTLWVAIATVGIALAARGKDYYHPVMRPIIWLAGISYCVYLVNHNIGYSVMYQLSEAGWPPMAQSGAMLVVAVVLGWALTRLVEEPAANWLRSGGLWSRRKAARAAAAGGSATHDTVSQDTERESTVTATPQDREPVSHLSWVDTASGAEVGRVEAPARAVDDAGRASTDDPAASSRATATGPVPRVD